MPQLQCEEIRFPSADGVHTVAASMYTMPGVPVRAVLQLSHGMCEYVQRYHPMAQWEERHQAEKEVDQRKAAFFQWKNVLGDIDLAQQRAVFQHAFHRHAGGFAEEVEHQLANDQKQREILNAIPALVEQRAEHSPHDKAG